MVVAKIPIGVMKIIRVIKKIPRVGIMIRNALALPIAGGLQLVLPFLIQQMADIGIKNKDIDFIWLVFAGLMMVTLSRTVVDLWRPREDTYLRQLSMGTMFPMVTFVVYAAVLCWYDPLIFCIFLAGSFLYGLWIALFLNRRKVLGDEQFTRQVENKNVANQMITLMQEIKMQSCEWRITEEWQQAQMYLSDVQKRNLKLKQQQEAGCTLINETKNIVITVFSAIAVVHGDLTLGMMLAILYIIGQLYSPIEQLTYYYYSMQEVKMSSELFKKVLKAREYGVDGWRKKEYKNGRKEMELQGVNFKYDPQSPKWILQDVSFKIPEGKVTAIVGASGSGKTTIIKLLLKYYTIFEEEGQGNINLAGWFLSLYSFRWWYQRCGVVMEDGTIFSDSVARNIAISDREIDEKRLIRAAEIACCKDFIMRLPQQFDTKIGRDGMGLSLGEKQRILIARAVYKNSDFLFLDEATNSLDAMNEQQIVDNLEQFYQGKTVIIATQRLPMVKHADQIVVLDDGKVAEIGTHEDLMAKRGTYYKLMRNQQEALR